MPKVKVNAAAPDFSLNDQNGECRKLSDFKGRKHIVLVLNRGFM